MAARNFFVSEGQRTAKLADFGMCCGQWAHRHQTAYDEVLSSPEMHMCLPQRVLGPAQDMFALGGVFYTMLTGELQIWVFPYMPAWAKSALGFMVCTKLTGTAWLLLNFTAWPPGHRLH